MTKEENINNKKAKPENREKEQEKNEQTPINKISPGEEGRSWRQDSADFSEPDNNTKF